MVFIFDTNIYRNLVHGLTMVQVVELAEKLQRCEMNTGNSSAASTVVTMELMKHLIDGDPAIDDCFKALCLQFLHTTKDDGQGNRKGPYIPPMNIILAQYFFSKDSKYIALYHEVHNLAIELIRRLNIADCKQHEALIKAVGNQILHEKEEFRQNTEQMLASMNGGAVNWKYFSDNKKEREEFFKKLHNGDITRLLAIGLMNRAHQVTDINDPIPDVAEKLNNFLNEYKAAMIMNLELMKLIGQGVEKLQDVNDSRWNTLNDVQIMFGMLYKNGSESKKAMVTEETAIKRAAYEAGVPDTVLCLADYKAAVNFDTTP